MWLLGVKISGDDARIDSDESDRSKHDEDYEVALESPVILRISVDKHPIVHGVQHPVPGSSRRLIIIPTKLAGVCVGHGQPFLKAGNVNEADSALKF